MSITLPSRPLWSMLHHTRRSHVNNVYFMALRYSRKWWYFNLSLIQTFFYIIFHLIVLTVQWWCGKHAFFLLIELKKSLYKKYYFFWFCVLFWTLWVKLSLILIHEIYSCVLCWCKNDVFFFGTKKVNETKKKNWNPIFLITIFLINFSL